MDVTTSMHDGTAIIRLRGRFDFSGHRVFRDAFKIALTNESVRDIKVDLGAVEYVDSSALGTLLLSRQDASAAGKVIVLAGASGAVKQVLDIANFHKLFTVV
jgi:anti-anti-sigma factor